MKKKVLIIEDELNIRETLSDLLNMHGYSTLQAENGREGISKALKEAPEIILCDINMPDMDGYQVLSELRKKDCLTMVPFIFLTAKTTMEELRMGMELGADDYLTKPFSHESLIRTIKMAEQKKMAHAQRLTETQNQLNLEKLKLRDIDYLNSHEARRKLSVIQGLFPLLKSGEITFEQGLITLEEYGEDLDLTIHEISRIVNESNGPEIKADRSLNPAQVKDIWLIDDDPAQNLLTQMILRKTNLQWHIINFQDPEKALNQISTKVPDLIFLDINMPNMNGFEFLNQLEQRDIDVKVIMLSSSISQSDIQKAINHEHVIHYLTKPLKKEKIAELFL